MKISLVLFGLLFSLFKFTFAQANDPAYQSYLAHIAAANSALRLNEGVEAKRWIVNSPKEHRGWEWNYLQHRSDQSSTIHRFTDPLPTRASYSPKGDKIIIPMNNGTIHVVIGKDFSVLRILEGHINAVYNAKFSPDERYIVSCSRDSTIICWDYASGKQRWKVPSHGRGLADVDISPDGKKVLFSSWYFKGRNVKGLVSLHDMETGAVMWKSDYDVKPVVAARFSPDGTMFAIGTWNWQVAIWKTAQPDLPPVIFNYNDDPSYSAIDDIAFSPDNAKIAAASKSTRPRVWDIQSGKLDLQLTGHTKPVLSICYSRDGKYIYTAGDEGTIFIWNAHTGTFINKIFGHESAIKSIQCSPDGTSILTSSTDKTIRTWTTSMGIEFQDTSGRNETIYAFALTNSGTQLAMAGPNNSMAIWDAKRGTLIKSFPALNAQLNAADFTSDGKLVAGLNWGTTVKLWNVATGETVRLFEGQEEGGSGIDISPNDKLIATACNNKTVYVWNLQNGILLKKIPHARNVYFVQFSPDGKMLASGDGNGMLTLWNAETFDSINSVKAHIGSIYSISFSADSKQILTGGEDGIAVVLDTKSLKPKATLQGHAQRIWTVSFSPDGKRIVTGSADLTVRIWETSSYQTTLILSEFTDPVYNVVFSSDSEALFVNSTGKEITRFNSK